MKTLKAKKLSLNKSTVLNLLDDKAKGQVMGGRCGSQNIICVSDYSTCKQQCC